MSWGEMMAAWTRVVMVKAKGWVRAEGTECGEGDYVFVV